MELRGELRADRPLVVVALAGEAAHLSTVLPILVTGVGKLAAAGAVLELLAPLSPHERPRGLLNLGTAGALRDELEGVHVVGRVRQHDIDGPAIEALTGVDPSPVLELGEGVVLASGDQFISDPSRRARLAAVADLCDMEGYAVAAAALRLGLEATLVKHVSDQAGTGAAASWTDAVSGSSAALGRWLASHPDASVS